MGKGFATSNSVCLEHQVWSIARGPVGIGSYDVMSGIASFFKQVLLLVCGRVGIIRYDVMSGIASCFKQVLLLSMLQTNCSRSIHASNYILWYYNRVLNACRQPWNLFPFGLAFMLYLAYLVSPIPALSTFIRRISLMLILLHWWYLILPPFWSPTLLYRASIFVFGPNAQFWRITSASFSPLHPFWQTYVI